MLYTPRHRVGSVFQPWGKGLREHRCREDVPWGIDKVYQAASAVSLLTSYEGGCHKTGNTWTADEKHRFVLADGTTLGI